MQQTTGGFTTDESPGELLEVPKFKKLRMVTHFMARPPLPTKHSRNEHALMKVSETVAKGSPKQQSPTKLPEIQKSRYRTLSRLREHQSLDVPRSVNAKGGDRLMLSGNLASEKTRFNAKSSL